MGKGRGDLGTHQVRAKGAVTRASAALHSSYEVGGLDQGLETPVPGIGCIRFHLPTHTWPLPLDQSAMDAEHLLLTQTFQRKGGHRRLGPAWVLRSTFRSVPLQEVLLWRWHSPSILWR